MSKIDTLNQSRLANLTMERDTLQAQVVRQQIKIQLLESRLREAEKKVGR